MGAVFVFVFVFLFPHKKGGVCKCASAIWTLSGVGLRKSCRRHKNMRQDPLTGLCVVVDPETWINHGVEALKDGLCFCGKRSAGLHNPRGN